MDAAKIITELQKKLKHFSKCPEYCDANCCRKMAPVLMTYAEWQALPPVLTYAIEVDKDINYCPFLTAKHCAIYFDRPMPCRWYGLSASGDAHCPDIQVDRLPEAVIETIRKRWTSILYNQLAQTYAGMRINADRLRWYKYCQNLPMGKPIFANLEAIARKLPY